jgi:hypothetical protein
VPHFFLFNQIYIYTVNIFSITADKFIQIPNTKSSLPLMRIRRPELQPTDSKEHNFQKISGKQNKWMTMDLSCSLHCTKLRAILLVSEAKKIITIGSYYG